MDFDLTERQSFFRDRVREFIDANVRPRVDVPAWYSTGVRCGDGSDRCGPGTLKNRPTWLIS